jgi:hypothetical protein
MKDFELIEGTLELAAKSLPEGFELYDFGGGNIIAPVPDLTNDKGWLLDHMAAVARVRNHPSDPAVITGFGFDLRFVTARQIVEGMEKAVEVNRTQTTQFSIIGKTQETQQC